MRRDQVPVIYYTNLLISNLIQMCTIIIIVAKPDDHETYMMSFVIYYFGVQASLYFKLCIALERYLSNFQCVYLHVLEYYIVL